MSGLGAMEDVIQKQVELYSAFKKERVDKGLKEPRGDGVIVFDEVKVISRLMWNSRSQKMIGLAMTPDEMSSLHDIFMSYDEDANTEQTSYILQFLWRDLTSPFDIIGPYFTSSQNFKAKHVIGYVYETIKLFELYGFHTSALVCDGAGPNLAAIKSMSSGISGAYGTDSEPGTSHKIPTPFFSNPFNPPNKIYWVICPSNQVCKIDEYAYLLPYPMSSCICTQLCYTVEKFNKCPLLIS